MNHEDHPHPLLAQVPLTVSPFISLPTATPLPYTYKTLPSTLPPSITDPPATSTNTTATPQPSDADGAPQQAPPKSAYVVSSSGHAAHPDDIIASCRALQTHLTQLIDDTRSVVGKWDEQLRERDLARKRQIAPGWLDQDVKMLEPERKGGASSSLMQTQQGPGGAAAVNLLDDEPQPQVQSDEGEQLDRAFGGMNIQ
ncbi:uncharacterized protein J3D65DRAFT_40129 [Phyllosticta citribraziliensis]|uniref:Uncharacterized protein n=1 Tax=Phyllosticta citribraziliensis TaxID=989973 RepID=A0ABR1MAI3_9PEZI